MPCDGEHDIEDELQRIGQEGGEDVGRPRVFRICRAARERHREENAANREREHRGGHHSQQIEPAVPQKPEDLDDDVPDRKLHRGVQGSLPFLVFGLAASPAEISSVCRALASRVWALPGASGCCCEECGAQPCRNTTSKPAGMRPSAPA